MKISVIIPNYDGEDLLKKNLRKVLGAVSSYDSEVIVVDDYSQDNSVQVVQEFIPKYKTKIKLKRNEYNMGFSSTINRGVALSSGEILILLNTDVSPREDFLDSLLKHFDDSKVFAVGCMDESVENGKIVERGRGVGKWSRGFLQHKLGDLSKPSTLWVSAGSGAFRKSIWNELGGLDEIYNPFYWEDIDISYRASKRGYTNLFDINSAVRHEHAEGAIKRNYSESAVRKISYRNQIYFVWLNITSPLLLLSHLFWLPYHILTTLIRGDLMFSSALVDAFLNLGTVIKMRNMRKKENALSDKNVLAPFVDEFSTND